MGIQIEEELHALRERVRRAETEAAKQKAVRDLAVAARDGERRKEHTAKLKAIVVTAINAKRVAPSTLTHFTTRFGADGSDAMMGATSDDVHTWLKVSGRPDKTASMHGASVAEMVTRGVPRDETGEDAGVSNSDRYEAAYARAADELGIPLALRFSAANMVVIGIAVQQDDPELARAHGLDPAGG